MSEQGAYTTAAPEWTPVKVLLSELDLWQDNPKLLLKADAEKLTHSRKTLGKAGVFLVGPSTNGRRPTYDGHQRFHIWSKHGDNWVWALESSRPLTDEERRAVSIMTITATGSLDWQKLAGWDFAELTAFGMDGDLLKGLNNDALNLREMMGSETPIDPNAEWEGMPEFEQEDLMPNRTIKVHFMNDESVKEFCNLIGQSIKDETKYIWFPEQKRRQAGGSYENTD